MAIMLRMLTALQYSVRFLCSKPEFSVRMIVNHKWQSTTVNLMSI